MKFEKAFIIFLIQHYYVLLEEIKLIVINRDINIAMVYLVFYKYCRKIHVLRCNKKSLTVPNYLLLYDIHLHAIVYQDVCK